MGNPGHRPINHDEPKPEGDLFDAPDWMTDQQKAGWAYAIAHSPAGLLKKLDRSILAIWVIAEDIHREASLSVAKFGMVTKSPVKGDPMQNPYLSIVNKQAQIMLKSASEMGFTPSSRSRITVDDGGMSGKGSFASLRK